MILEDVIPITYMGGTGGVFLCHLIVSAKRNIQDIIELSEHGNAHTNCLTDIVGPMHGVRKPDIIKINYLIDQVQQVKNIEKPYYTFAHLTDLNLINLYFKKSIRITYEHDDINEIVNVFYGKYYYDWIKKVESKELYKNLYKNGLNFYLNKFTEVENVPNILFISWKEYLRGNIDDLIYKLSTFTDIHVGNFSKESLIHWRNKTQYCIDTFTEI
jgi:hypothetical protein